MSSYNKKHARKSDETSLRCLVIGHRFDIVAYDPSFKINFTGESGAVVETSDYDVTYLMCRHCGRRKAISSLPARYTHKQLVPAMTEWVGRKTILLLEHGDMYRADDLFKVIAKSKDGKLVRWKLDPLTGIEQILNALRDDDEFKALVGKNQTVDDALGQLEIAIKLTDSV